MMVINDFLLIAHLISMIAEVSTKITRYSEKSDMQRYKSAFKKFDEAIKRNIQVHNQTADRIKENAKQNHEVCEKAKLEQQKQEKEHDERKAAKEKRLSEIEAKISVMFYGFENVKKSSDESANKVNENTKTINDIAERMDVVLSEAKDAEILMLHSRLNQQDKEIEMLKSMITEQKRILELYMQFNSK